MVDVFYVTPLATVLTRLPDDWRLPIAAVLRRAQPPVACGCDIPVAPARGPMQAFVPREMVVTDAGNLVSRRSGYMGRDGARVADAFDLMTMNALKAHPKTIAAARVVHGRRAQDQSAKGVQPRPFVEPDFVPPFTHGQVAAARDYAALSERCASSGLSCSSLETIKVGSSGGDREAAVFRDFARLRSLQRRIGDGLAKEVRRYRPSATGGRRSAIRVRTLVDQVCLGGLTLDEVLRANGWGKCDGRVRADLRSALCGALDRMQGYDLSQPQNVG
jgi:hypothetical protein